MSDKRQKNQLELAFDGGDRGEAPKGLAEGTESLAAKRGTESPAIGEQLMEEVCERENCKQALARVKANKGKRWRGRDDRSAVAGAPETALASIREQLLSGTYKPQPVKRVEIPKPDGGVRKLGIPTVLDRFIQQAVMQVLQRRWDRTFSDHSYGFRPGRSAHQAVEQAQQYIAAGYRWVVDLDWRSSSTGSITTN
jgi:RNA-directed DNA polymerase